MSNWIKTSDSSKKNMLFMLLTGLALTCIVFGIGSALGLNDVKKRLTENMEQLRKQCVSYDEIITADKVKSLIRLTEQSAELCENAARDNTILNIDYLEKYAHRQRIAGIVLLDENFNTEYEYCDFGENYKNLKEELNNENMKNIKDYPQKVYSERIYVNGQCYDVAAVSRSDKKGMVCCYRYQSSDLMALHMKSIETLMSGHEFNKGGIVYMAEGDFIKGTNGEKFSENRISELPIVCKLAETKNKSKYVYFKEGKRSYIGAKHKYKNYDLYAYYPSSSVIMFSMRFVMTEIIIYMSICMYIYMMRNSIEKKHLTELNRQINTLKAISSIYVTNILINLKNGSYDIIKASEMVSANIGSETDAVGMLNVLKEKCIDAKFKDEYREFVDISTMGSRLKKKDYVEKILCTIDGVWRRCILIADERDDNGNVVSVIFVVRDIDEMKRLEIETQKKLEQATKEAVEANAAKTDFLRRMSHDVRTPINIIIGMTEMAGHFPENYERQRYCREKTKEAAEMLLELVNDVLFLNKLEFEENVSEEYAFDISTVLNGVYSLIETQTKQAGILFETTEVKTSNYHLLGNPVHISQIIMNILSNSIKYTPSGGKISVSCEEIASDDEISTLRIVCADTGIGISEHFQKYMFEPFEQEGEALKSEQVGMGLGLAIVKSLTEKMNGSISVDSRKGEGTRFTIELKLKINRSGADEEIIHTNNNEKTLEGIKILMAEDNGLSMEIMDFMLSDNGAEVTAAWNGVQAFEIWKAAEPETFDIILMDMMMPEMDGIETTRAIRSSDRADAKTIPIIAMSANIFKEDIEKCERVGMNAHISKPINIQKLMDIIHTQIKK